MDDEDMTNTPEFPESSSTEDVDAIGAGGATATLPQIPAPSAPYPAQRRTSGWTIFFSIIAAAMAGMLMLVVGIFAVGAAVVAGIASGDIEVDTDRVDIAIVPETLADLPSSIVEENGKIEVDLTELNIADLDASDEPVGLDVDVDFGEITVIVPDGLDVSVNASSDLGDVTVFGDSDDGFSNTVIHTGDDAAIALDLDLDVGKIEVIKG